MSILTRMLETGALKNVDIGSIKAIELDDGAKKQESHVVVEGNVCKSDNDGEVILVGDHSDMWHVKLDDVLDAIEGDKNPIGVQGAPMRLKLKSGSKIRIERTLEIGVHILGYSEFEQLDKVIDQDSPPPGCRCAQHCGNNNYCCANGGWITQCQNSACAWTNVRC